MAANQGEVDITLGGETHTLRPTLRAAKEVNAAFGGFIAALQRLQAFDLAAYVTITAAGLGKKSGEIEEKVFAAGMASLIEPLSRFIGYLSNGGREPPAEGEETPKGE